MLCPRLHRLELHAECHGDGHTAFLARHRFLGLLDDVSEVPRLSADSIQRTRDVWDGRIGHRLHVGVGQRGRLEEVQAAYYECP